mmetsp:Transcript_1442/g.2766  ORF Transcript_1442/g.2766 Transcript_1442/m.2766 type:complete len:651 (+) Transcript_1442:235-2187(+)
MSVESDPYGELPLRNDKYAALCTELHLSNRNINTLCHFNAFTQLSTLWVNENKLTKLEGLDKNVRLRNLHAHGNRIRTLEGSSLAFFKFLEYLTLNDNLLESIADVVGEVKHLRHLKKIDLFGNPISQEDNYRLLIISEIPWLQCLDRVTITKTELKEAMNLKSRLKKMMDLKASSKGDADDSTTKLSAREQSGDLLENLLPYIKKALRSKRVVLEARFLEDDPRKTGMVSVDNFQAVLKQYGILEIVSDDELSALAHRYSAVLKLSGIAPTHTFAREMIDYRKFCDDFLNPGLRVQNPGLQKLDTWKMELVPEVSVTANDLRCYVNTNKRAKEFEARKTKREALFAGSNQIESNTNFSFKSTVNDSDRQHIASESWSRYVLSQLVLEEINKDSDIDGNFDTVSAALKSSIQFSKAKVSSIFEKMSNHGSVPTNGAKECLRNLFQGETSSVSVESLCCFLGLGTDRGIPGVQWRSLTETEKLDMETSVFEEAGALLESLLRSSSAEESEAKLKRERILSSTISAATTGTRLAASKRVRNTATSITSPHEVMHAAPNRSDLIVIPALKSAAIRSAKDDELKKTHDWESEFAALGVHGDALQIALMRKKRSIMADEEKLKQGDSNKLVSRFPVRSKNESKGWGSSTGTVILK